MFKFRNETSPIPEVSPTEQLIVNVINDLSYTAEFLSGTDREKGIYVFQPQHILPPLHPEEPENRTPVHSKVMDSICNTLCTDLEKAGIDALVEVEQDNIGAVKIRVQVKSDQ